ncbi:MAG TPA: WecB/TagA/CpsF family glycosyltransferase [Leptolyngbyaceae cyanobacterium]
MTKTPQPFPVLGLPVHLLDDYPGWLLERLHQHMGGHVITLNAEMSIQAEQNTSLAKIIHQADLVIPDGSGVVLYLWFKGKRVQRCPGIELAETLLWQVGDMGQNWPVFFFGGKPGVTEKAARIWQQRLPSLAIAGIQHGYLSSEEEQQLLQTLQELQPRLILVGLGVPRQELWIAQHRHLCPKAIWIGVGGSFDIWAGVKNRAPGWLRDNHLEWLYRLYQEPWRWRRMLALPKFVWRALVKSTPTNIVKATSNSL